LPGPFRAVDARGHCRARPCRSKVNKLVAERVMGNGANWGA